MWLYIIIGILAFLLYIGNKLVRHVTNTIIIWALIATRWIIGRLLWLFQKIDGVGRTKKPARTQTKVAKEQEVIDTSSFNDEELEELSDLLKRGKIRAAR
jgi:hypothetical protein